MSGLSPINTFPAGVNLTPTDPEDAKNQGKVLQKALEVFETQKGSDAAEPREMTVNQKFNRYLNLLGSRPESLDHPFVAAVANGDKEHISKFVSLMKLGFDINCRNDNEKTAAHAAAAYGDQNLLSQLALEGLDFSARDKWQNTPLHDAVVAKNAAAVDWILQRPDDEVGKILNERNSGGYTALDLARLEGFDELANKLVDAGANITLD